MDILLKKALEAIDTRINSGKDVNFPDDRNAVNEMFLRLQIRGIPLVPEEIEAWALIKGWVSRRAKEMADWARQINAGEEPLILDGPWWPSNILEVLALDITLPLPARRVAGKDCANCLMHMDDCATTEKCLMEIIRSQWCEPFGNTYYCEHPEAERFVSLANTVLSRFDERKVGRE